MVKIIDSWVKKTKWGFYIKHHKILTPLGILGTIGVHNPKFHQLLKNQRKKLGENAKIK